MSLRAVQVWQYYLAILFWQYMCGRTFLMLNVGAQKRQRARVSLPAVLSVARYRGGGSMAISACIRAILVVLQCSSAGM